jgi:hypothetical protein
MRILRMAQFQKGAKVDSAKVRASLQEERRED